MTNKQIGTVKWFNAPKGYGFIVNESGEDVLVHHNAVLMEGFRDLADGQRVRFLQVQSSSGLASAEVVLVAETESV